MKDKFKMNNKIITQLIKERIYPQNPLIPLDAPFVDDRGSIQNLITNGIESISVITSKTGSVRSNHYHLHSGHYLYVSCGVVQYYERNLDGSNILIKEYGPGEMFFTPPNKVHKLVFITDSLMISLAPMPNDHDSHEEDLVRCEF